jgi:hypothetical protein
MVPYRLTRLGGAPVTLRLAAPRSAGGIVAQALLVLSAGSFLLWLHAFGGARWQDVAPFAAFGVCTIAPALLRRRAWVVVVPSAERLRVARSSAFHAESTVMRLSRDLSAEIIDLEGRPWLVIAARDGRFTRVLPASDPYLLMDARARVERALHQAQ